LSLRATLERPLPAIPVGSATAVFCAGSCWHPEQPLADLQILVDGEAHRAAAFGMPRPDLAAAGAPSRSGFWGTVPVRAPARPGRIELRLQARLTGGRLDESPLGELEVLPVAAPPPLEARPAHPGAGLIAVCMATFEPDMALLRTQIESLRAQRDERWVCLISDDCSRPERFEQVRATVAGDHRFAISRSAQRLGFYRNFERALSMVPAEAELVALSDQDDCWHPDKLGVLRDRIGGALLIYSDQRLVEADGTLRRGTLWQGRRNNYDNRASMLVANTVTGAAAMFRRELLEVAVPFPDAPGFQFHDHWLAVAALAAGEVAYVEQSLYDYVQHPGAVFGDVTHGSGAAAAGGRLVALRRRYAPTSWRAAYFYGYLAREVQAQTALLRCAGRLTARKRRALELFIACDRSTSALGWLVVRTARGLLGRTETLQTELELAQGIAWKRAIEMAGRGLPGFERILGDARIPPPQDFTQKRLRRWRARL